MDGYGEVYLPYATLQSVKIKSVKFFFNCQGNKIQKITQNIYFFENSTFESVILEIVKKVRWETSLI